MLTLHKISYHRTEIIVDGFAELTDASRDTSGIKPLGKFPRHSIEFATSNQQLGVCVY